MEQNNRDPFISYPEIEINEEDVRIISGQLAENTYSLRPLLLKSTQTFKSMKRVHTFVANLTLIFEHFKE